LDDHGTSALERGYESFPTAWVFGRDGLRQAVPYWIGCRIMDDVLNFLGYTQVMMDDWYHVYCSNIMRN
jgi:hypothetical protein